MINWAIVECSLIYCHMVTFVTILKLTNLYSCSVTESRISSFSSIILHIISPSHISSNKLNFKKVIFFLFNISSVLLTFYLILEINLTDLFIFPKTAKVYSNAFLSLYQLPLLFVFDLNMIIKRWGIVDFFFKSVVFLTYFSCLSS